MRLNTCSGDFMDWLVWHAEWCKRITTTVWVDDKTHQWLDYTNPHHLVVRQEKRILILFNAKLVIINPVDDSEGAEDFEYSVYLPIIKLVGIL